MSNRLYTPWQRLVRLLTAERQLLGRVLLIAAFGGLIGLSLPLGIQAIINFIQVGRISTSWIVLVSFVLVGIFLSGWLQIRQQWLVEYLQQRIFAKASMEFSMRIPRILFEQLEKRNPAELMNRFFDVLTVQKGVSKLIIDFSTAVLQVFFGLILLALYHPFFILFDILIIALVVILIRMAMGRGLETSIKESTWKYSVVRWLEEVAVNLESFRMTPKTDMAVETTDGLTDNYVSARRDHFRVLVRHYIALLIFKLLIAAGLLVLGSILVIENQIGIGQFVAAEIVILLITSSVEKIILNLETVYDVLTALEKIGSVTDLELEEEGELDNYNNDATMLEIDSVELLQDNYQVPLVIDHFEVNAGERVFIQYTHPFFVRTMVQLITGRKTDYSGHLTFRGRSVKSLNLANYRSRLGELWGRDELFSGSILDNIRLGRDISNDEIEQTLENIGLLREIRMLPEAENTKVQPFSNLISPVIVKGILLARNLIDEPDLLLIDAEQLPSDPIRYKQMLEFLLDPFHSWSVVFFSESRPETRFFDRYYKYDQGTLKGCEAGDLTDPNSDSDA
jgi:ABC-type bacteriocin/lantibiotic exporter with double-glycine peptidase domain